MIPRRLSSPCWVVAASGKARRGGEMPPGFNCGPVYCRTVVTIDEVRALALTLPRSSEGYVRGQVKFRVGRIVYLSISRDGSIMGFAFPKAWRDALVESEPDKFSLPSQSDLRYHWAHVRLGAIDADEMRDLVEDAWAFVVPKRVAEEYATSRGY
jgi:hypothetical protein